MSEEVLQFQLDHFEGPMDLLIYLIEKNKIQIEDIPIAELITQYFLYLENAKKMNLEIASSFLVMATQLIKIKVRLLLPKHKDSEDPKAELIDKLVEYRFFKEEAEDFSERYSANLCYHYREIDEVLLKEAYQIKLPLMPMKAELLTGLLDTMFKRFEEVPEIVIAKETYQVEDFIDKILTMVGQKELSFQEILVGLSSKPAIITMFLALLEALRRDYITITQTSDFAPIIIYANEV